jgi:hypothetical protein
MEHMEGTNQPENTEKPTWHYTYSNNELPGHPVVFECDAESIIEADNLFEQKLGITPERNNHIGCSIVKN